MAWSASLIFTQGARSRTEAPCNGARAWRHSGGVRLRPASGPVSRKSTSCLILLREDEVRCGQVSDSRRQAAVASRQLHRPVGAGASRYDASRGPYSRCVESFPRHFDGLSYDQQFSPRRSCSLSGSIDRLGESEPAPASLPGGTLASTTPDSEFLSAGASLLQTEYSESRSRLYHFVVNPAPLPGRRTRIGNARRAAPDRAAFASRNP